MPASDRTDSLQSNPNNNSLIRKFTYVVVTLLWLNTSCIEQSNVMLFLPLHLRKGLIVCITKNRTLVKKM